MKVSRSGFYAWSTREEPERAKQDRKLEVLVRAAHDGSRKTYGSPRVHAELAAHGHRISRKRPAADHALKCETFNWTLRSVE